MTDESFEKIYLCRGDYETTWCQDRIDDDDIEYIRADIAEQRYQAALAEGERRMIEKGRARAGMMTKYRTGMTAKTSCTRCGSECYYLCFIGSKVVCVDCFGAECERRKASKPDISTEQGQESSE